MSDSARERIANRAYDEVRFSGDARFTEDDDYEDDGLMEDEATKLLADDRTNRGQGNGGVNNGTVFTYEESLSAVGTGKFHLLLLLLCGWAVSSDAVEVLSVSFLLPSATCDLQLTSHDKGWLNAIVFVGMMVGGYFWGSLADRQGRRSVLMWSLMVNGIGGLLSSVSQVFWLFLLFRFISGIGVGGSIPVIFTYFTEFQARHRRGSMISVLATFWMAGNIIAAGLAWLVIPHASLGYFSSEFTYNSWRIFIALCTIPAISSAAIFVLMPESPKFLLKMGHEDQARRVLKKIHRSNHSLTNFNISQVVLAIEESGKKEGGVVGIEESGRESQRGGKCGAICSLWENTLELFRPRLRMVTCLLLIINFAIAFGYYGLFMWFPEIFHRIDQNGGTMCEPGPQDNSTNNNSSNSACEPVGDIVYLEGFLTAVSNLPGNLLTIALMDRIGRKILLCEWYLDKRW